MDLSPERVRVGESLPAMVVMGLGRPGPGPDIVEPEDRDELGDLRARSWSSASFWFA